MLELKGKSSGFLKNMKALFAQDLPELESCLDDLINITDLLAVLGCDYAIDIASGRGFEYYTGMMFQLFIGEEKIGGGGRYDALIPLMGGRDIPASGFALYLDRLVNLVTPETLAKPLGERILIRAEPSQPEIVKEGFNIASRLHEAGYMAELDLGGQEPASLRWTLDVRSKAPFLILTDQVKHRKFEAQTTDEILAMLGKEEASGG
ncbi:MAG: ATP phosphoribosyltransferase regulatory subunit [Dehalococcoidales bacterium]|nr:ATP phosphoribosyltransferase regulatory subunit [Dehalococcoidales bacterium]